MAARSGELSLTWGRSLYRRLRAQGLVNVGMEGYLAIREGRTPGARLIEANFEQIRQEAISAGFVTDEEVDQVLALLDDPEFAISASVMFTAWGRRPELTHAAYHLRKEEERHDHEQLSAAARAAATHPGLPGDPMHLRRG